MKTAKEITINYLESIKKEKIEQLRNVAGNKYMEFVVKMDIGIINAAIEIVKENEGE